MWKNIVETDRPQMTIWRMRIERCIPNTTDTHSEYVILIAFPLQQCLHQPVSILRLYIHCLCSSNGECECLSCRGDWTLHCSSFVASESYRRCAVWFCADFKLRTTTCTSRPYTTVNRRTEVPRSYAIFQLRHRRKQLSRLLALPLFETFPFHIYVRQPYILVLPVLFDFMFQRNAPLVYYIFSYSPTCFEQYCAHHQEELLYTHSIWFFVSHSS